MSWITENSLNWFQRLALRIVRTGAIPQHVAFIMDGNRRFATKANLDKVVGHSKGFDKLSESLKWCLDLGITEVTVYAFSIENFKRPSDEVNALMNLAKQKFEKLLEEEDELRKEGVNIRVIGDLSRLPPDLYKLMAKAVCITKDNSRARLTIAFSYTARNEMAEAARSVIQGVKDKHLSLSDVDASLIERCLYTEQSNPPDLLIRTSGEIRFSDFLLWQNSFACAYFTPVLWPEFTFWELLCAIFQYQRSVSILAKCKNLNENSSVTNDGVEKFITQLHENRYNKLKIVACTI